MGSPRTSFLAGSTFNVTWHLAYPHRVNIAARTVRAYINFISLIDFEMNIFTLKDKDNFYNEPILKK
ncbi:hypothetical protein Bhyg_07433 [Pseudolycoriella hygida]|uniref:Uncharacterized protein n=1 Tax=Pseudolycoriella hygida TaxID=35572 RepID=A0A9Q0N3M6_9DIPT|nr:hypothetical protein Bhyg_07433 [Pseudolycoriella hygida]